MASKDLGLFNGRKLEDGVIAFYPSLGDLSGDPTVVVDAYKAPVTPPAENWYFANVHTKAHSGLDINLNRSPWGDVDLGEPVFSCCNGIVVFSGMTRGTSWGRMVIVCGVEAGYGLLFWRYAHLQDVMARPGQIVRPGQQIGTIGKGYNDRYWAHLHLDAWRGQMIAPETWLASWVDWVDPLSVWPDWGWGGR